jgi:predicted enzyme related to lactoylglutathione lyase
VHSGWHFNQIIGLVALCFCRSSFQAKIFSYFALSWGYRKIFMSLEARVVLIILGVSDLPRSSKFYRDVFGWPQTVDVPVYAEFESPGGLHLGLYLRDRFGINTGQTPMAIPEGQLASTEIYIHTQDVATHLSRLEAAGARLLSSYAVRDWGDEAAYFSDPDGNVIVIARPANS